MNCMDRIKSLEATYSHKQIEQAALEVAWMPNREFERLKKDRPLCAAILEIMKNAPDEDDLLALNYVFDLLMERQPDL